MFPGAAWARSTPLLRFALLAAVAGASLGSVDATAAPPPPTPWRLTGTSSVADVGAPRATHRVERRRLQKDQRLVVRAGASYLSRGDLRINPGLSVDLAWYPTETLGIDLVSATVFFSSLRDAAIGLRRTTGLLPDSQKPLARIATGGRASIAYGKLLVEAFDTVVHFDANAALHVGVLATDSAINVAGDLGLGLQIGLGGRTPPPLLRAQDGDALGRVVIWIDALWLLSYERRSGSSLGSGPMATVGVGVLL